MQTVASHSKTPNILTSPALFGYIADHCRSRRIPFICGLAALGTSTALFAFARTFPILVIARCLQGLSAAAVWVVGLALISDNVSSDRVAAAMGQTSIGLTWGFVLGPVLGGVIYDKLGYYDSFLPAALLIILDIVLRFAIIEKSGKIFLRSFQLYQHSDSSKRFASARQRTA